MEKLETQSPEDGTTEPQVESIPFNRPSFVGDERKYIREAVDNGHISGDGPFTRRCHAWLEEKLGVDQALLTTSCTHALEMAAILLDLGPGDEVILPSFTFVSTTNSFVLRGARPVFADIRPDTLNLDESKIESLITPRTKVILPVHYAGVGCEMDTICEIAEAKSLAIVEDNAHGLLARYRGRYLGTFGALATQSFHETKNITCGEGGALLINDPSLIERAEIVREKGTNRAQFFRGQVDKYSWTDIGSSYLPSDLLAAFLFAQFESFDAIQRSRKRIWEGYRERLSEWAERTGVGLPFIPEHCEQNYHMFYLLCPTPEKRDEAIAGLRDRNILAVFHYVPLHLSPMGQKFDSRPGRCPVTEDISERLVRLPFYNSLSDPNLDRICDALYEITSSW